MIIRHVSKDDLSALIEIENQCFTKEEAASKEALEERINIIPDSFIVAEEAGVVAGYVNGPVITTPFITDDLFNQIRTNPKRGYHQSILGLAVSPQFQGAGIATSLLDHLEKEAIERSRETITLTCKENLIDFYENKGFINEGISNSTHGGETWFNMIKRVKS